MSNLELITKEREDLNAKITQMQAKLSEQGQQVSSLTTKNRQFSVMITQHEATHEVISILNLY